VPGSGVGGGAARGQAHPQKFWFGENADKLSENPGKVCNLRKSVKTFAKFEQKWRPTYFYLKKIRPTCPELHEDLIGGRP